MKIKTKKMSFNPLDTSKGFLSLKKYRHTTHVRDHLEDRLDLVAHDLLQPRGLVAVRDEGVAGLFGGGARGKREF